MSDLQPIDMLTTEIGSGEDHTFYIYVEQSPAKIKIAFSVTSENSKPVDFRVRFERIINAEIIPI